MLLNQKQKEIYEQNGYLVIEDFVNSESCELLRERAEKIVSEFDYSESVSIFTTKEQTRHSDDYFMKSGDKIRCFFEEEAFGEHGELRQDKSLSINKIGHAMHDLDPIFEEFSRNQNLASVVESIGLVDPQILQSMYIFKQPYIGGEVTCHQDATFLYTDPISVTGFWFAQNNATEENGCLWAIPGGHKTPLKSRFFRNENGEGTDIEILDDTPWDLSQMIPLEVKQGTLVVLHGLLPHMSFANRSKHCRHAFTLHMIERTAEYPDWNWLQRPPEMPLRGF